MYWFSSTSVPHRDVYERFAEIFLESILAQGLAGASRHVHDRESSTATGLYDCLIVKQGFFPLFCEIMSHKLVKIVKKWVATFSKLQKMSHTFEIDVKN